MSLSQIRLARTSDINKVLAYLRQKYQLLSEAEIIKLALSEKYTKEQEQNLKDAYQHAMDEGKKLGIKLIKEKGLDPSKVTEQEFNDLILGTHKHND